MPKNKIGIGIEVDEGGATKKINGVSKAFDKLGGKGSGASLFGNVGAKAVGLGFNLIADAASGAVGFLTDAVTAFNDDAASVAALNVLLKNNIPAWDGVTTAVETYTDAQIERGFSDDDTRASIGQLIGVTHNLQEAMQLTTIAEDLSRAKNIDLAQATDIVTKAHEGNGKALKGLGIEIAKGATAAEILDAIQKNVNGSADAWANTTSGKLQIAQVKFGEVMEKLGGVILPILTTVIGQLVNEWLPALGRGWEKVRPIIGAVGDVLYWVQGAIFAVVAAIKSAIGWIGDLIGALDRGLKKIGKFIDSLQMAHAEAKVNPGPAGITGGGFGHAAGGWVGLHGPEIAMVGERGPEYIVPNHGLQRGMIGHSFHNHPIYMDGKKVADAVSERQFYDLRRAALASKV